MMTLVVEPDDLGRIDLGGTEMAADRLADAETLDLDDSPLGAALAGLIASEFDEDEVPSSWRLLVEEPGRAIVGGCVAGWEQDPSEDSSEGPWVVIELIDEPSGWCAQSCALWTRPMPTRRAKGHGLVLEWPAEVVEGSAGEAPQLELWLRNGSTQPWKDLRGGDLVAFVGLEDLNGRSLPGSTRMLCGVGAQHRLEPGEIRPVAALVFTDDLERLPPGRYRLRATMHCYDLAADAVLVLT